MALEDEAEAGPSSIVHVPAYVGDTLSNVAVDVRRDPLVDVFNLLKGEAAPLNYWIEIAFAYHTHGLTESYEQVMKEAYENMNFLESTPEQKVTVLNSLCAYYTNSIYRAMAKQNEKQAARLLDLVNTYSSQAMTIDAFNATVFAIKAFAYLARGDHKSAVEYFDIALTTLDSQNIPSLLGKGIVAYEQKQFAKALDFYSLALKANPQCPGFVRLAMAYCWYRLKNIPKAKLCFQRVVDLEPNNVTALVGLALVDLNIRDKASFERSVRHLKRAFALQTNHPMVLNTFADHLFHNQYALNVARKAQGVAPGSYEKAEELATKAAECATTSQVKALAWYQIGRSRHAEGDLNEALNYYYQAVSTCQALPLAQYALAQMYVWKGQSEEAVKHLKAALTLLPEDRDTLMALGQLYIVMENDVEAQRVLRKLTDQHKSIAEAWRLYGFCTRHDSEFSLKCFARATRLIKEAQGDVDPRLWNDVAVLHHVAGYEEDAERLYLQALHKAGGELQQYELDHVPMVTNIARLREDQGRLEDSLVILRGLVWRFPSHMDPYLGLARIHLKMKDKQQAARWLELAMEVNPSRPEPWLMLGDTYSAHKEWIRAQDKYEHVLNHINKSEPHAQLGMGYLYLNALQQASLPNKEEKYSKLAADFYQKVLQGDTGNIYAAHGLGCYMAFRGYYDEARKSLARVSQAAFSAKEDTSSDTMMVNYANTHCMVGNYGTAVKMYQNIIKRYPSSVTKHSLYALLGQALFFNGDYEHCLAIMSKAVRTDPNNQRLWFNLALVQTMLALQNLQELQPGKPQNIRLCHYDKAKATLQLLTLALRAFERIHTYYGQFHHHPLFRFTKDNIALCQSHLPNATLCMDRASVVKAETEQKVHRFREQQQALEKRRKEEEEHRQAEQRRKEDEMRRVMEEETARLEAIRVRLMEQEQATQEQQKKKEASRSRRKASGDSGFVSQGEEENEGGAGDSAPEDQDYQTAPDDAGEPRRKKSKAHAADGENAPGGAPRAKKPKRSKHKERPEGEPDVEKEKLNPEERRRKKAEKLQRKEEKKKAKEERKRARDEARRPEPPGSHASEADPEDVGALLPEVDPMEGEPRETAPPSPPRKRARVVVDDEE